MNKNVIWLTGSRGFIGQHLLEELRSQSLEVKCFSNKQIEHVGSVASSCEFLDYLDKNQIKSQVELFGLPDVFIHLGWGAMTEPESGEHLDNNVKAGKILINTLFELGLSKFMFIGSMNEYGARTGSLSEDMEAQGRLTSYAMGKSQVTQFGLQCAKLHKRIFISARVFYVYGPGQRKGSLINQLFNSFKNESEVNLGPCEHYRDYIHVYDVAEGIRRLIEIDKTTIVNLGSGSVIKLKDFVILFWKTLSGDEERLKFGAQPMRQGEPEQPESFCNLERLKKLTNWMPSLSLEEGINITIKKLRENSSG